MEHQQREGDEPERQQRGGPHPADRADEHPGAAGAGGRNTQHPITHVFPGRLYQELRFTGASSHSGRRTFINQNSKKDR
jgi:hypothetical protein